MHMHTNSVCFAIQGVLRMPQTLKYFKDLDSALRKNGQQQWYGQQQQYILVSLLPNSCISINKCCFIFKISIFS